MPALKIYRAALQYAQANGGRFFTLADQKKWVARYLNFQSVNN